MNMSNNCGKFQLDGVVYEISNDRSSFKSRSLRLHRMNAFIRFGPRTRSQTKALQDEANDTCPIKTLNYFSFNTSSNYSSRSNVFGSSNSLQNYIKMSLESVKNLGKNVENDGAEDDELHEERRVHQTHFWNHSFQDATFCNLSMRESNHLFMKNIIP